MNFAHSLWFPQKRTAEIQRTSLAISSPDTCVIKTLYSSISPGTEKLVFQGKVPQTMYEQMSCPYMEGHFTFPIKYGYSLVGKVISGPKELQNSLVHVLHPHQDLCVVHSKDVYQIPNDIPPQRATLASNMETAVNAVWDAKIMMGEKVLIIGFGIIGSLIAQTIQKFPGIELHIWDTDASKRKKAHNLGFCVLENEKIDYSYDLCFHCSSSEEGLQFAIEALNIEGRVVELSWYGSRTTTICLGQSFHSLRKKIIGSQVSNIPGFMRSRWDYKRRKDLVFKLLRDKVFDLHITKVVHFKNICNVFKELDENSFKELSCLIEYSD